MGKRDSSRTRVQPVLTRLYESDASGMSWFQRLLRLGSNSDSIPPDFVPGPLSRCPQFEFRASPPRQFLQFLLENPSRLSAPSHKLWEQWSKTTVAKRRALLASDPAIQLEALVLLENACNLSKAEWWRLEGVTSVDCALFSQNTVVFLEGKRTELGPSCNITWWEGRNQVIRNLECLLQLASEAGCSNAYMLVIVEEDLCAPGTDRDNQLQSVRDPEVVARSLPHLETPSRDALMRHYLGTTTWQEIVRAFALGPEVLIDIME